MGTPAVTLPSNGQAISDSIDAYTQQQLVKQNSTLQANIAAATEKDPNVTAEAQRLGLQVGVGPDIASRNMAIVRKMAAVQDVGAQNLPQTAPKLAGLLQDPNFSGVAYDDIGSLSRIEQGATTMRAATPSERFYAKYEYPADKALMEYPLTRVFSEAVGGAADMLGNIGAFLGWHGNGPTRQNWLQRQAQADMPETYGYGSSELDAIAKNVAPMVPAMMVGGGTGLAARALGLSENASKVLTALGVGSAFTADQGGQTYTQMAAGGKSDAEARRAANLVAALNLVPNTAMGLTDFVPALERNPMLASLGVGAATGATGQFAQNVVTGQPAASGVFKGAIQGAAVMGGMHLGLGALAPLSDITDAVESSKLRARSPEAFQYAMNTMFEGDESLRIPAQDFVNYFAGKKIDPAEMANQVGVTNLDEAAAAGSDLEIPKANFFGKLDPEHQKGLLPDVVDPVTEMTARQAEAGHQELREWASKGGAQKLMEEYSQADAETQATPEWKSVYSDLKQRYVDAGETDANADSYATLHANAMANLAAGVGMKPDELLALHNPKIVAGESPDTVLHQDGIEPDDVLEQKGRGDDLEALKARNILAAKSQGEILTGGLGPKGDAQAEENAPLAEQPRGWFRMRPDGSYEIGKTSIGDLSTFIHEPAHAYLEMYRDLTQREGASAPLKDDFKKISEWLGTTPEDAYKNGFTREQHEKWAQANEQYVREGKAPSSGLRRTFHNFAVWMGSIYRRASFHGVELSSEVRGVMDRLYAGENAVDRAGQESGERLFKSPEEAGWTDAEYKNYAEAKGVGLDKARAQVAAELNDAALRDRTEKWREEKGNVRDAVTQEIDARPEYAAIRSLRRGKTDLGTDLTLNRDELVKQFGEDRVRALQQLHRGLYRQEGGMDAETASEMLGFGSGEEMMRALESAPRRAQAIESATRNYMAAKYGDIRYDGSLDSKARLAVENDERAKSMRSELTALRAKVAVLEKRAADSKAAMAAITVEPLEHYQEAARQVINDKSIADLQPYRYLNASRKFSREAFDALRKGDARAAAAAKNKELLNHFLFREASAARDYAEKFESYAKRMQTRGIQQRLGLAGSDYRDQFNWLLARYKLSAPMNAPERSLRDWADEAYGAGNEPAIAPGILNETRFGNYRNVPLSEVHDLHDALINVRHLAMREFKMFVQGKQVEFAEAKQSMIASLRDNLTSKPEKIFEENRSFGERVADVAEQGDAMLMRMERLVEWADGGKTGPWHDNLWNLAADAQGDEYDLQEKVTKPISDEIANMPESMRRKMWDEKVTVEGIPEPLTRRRLVSMAMNMGNEGNLDRLNKTFDSFGWDRDAAQRIGGMLTREEWQFVQKTWDSLKPIGDRMRELEQRLTGLPPAMVKAMPFKVALDDGTEMDLGGGYYPIKMDPRFSQRAIEQDSRESAQNAMQSGYVRATTSKGYTKERTGFAGPLDLDFERVLTDHLAKSTKDISHREFMLSSQRILLDTEVRKTLRETLGPAYEKQFMPWLRTIINDRNGSAGQGLEGMSNLMQTLRANVVAAEVGLKASTSLLQITHAPRMLLYAKPGSIAQSLIDFLARPREMTAANRELSRNEMRFRGDNLDRDIRAVLQGSSYKGGYEQKVARVGRWALQTIDHLFSHTLWRAAYRDGLEKYAELPEGEASQKAVYDADSAVRLGLGTSAPKDLPAIMRNNDFNKMITTLYGFHNGVYNQMRDNAHQFTHGGSVGKLTVATTLTAIVPALLGSLVTGDGPKDGENVGLWAAKRALLFSADTIPIIGSVAQFMASGRDMQFTPIEGVMEKGAKALMEASSGKEDKDWTGIGLDAGGALGALLGVPGSQQAVKTAKYARRMNEGKVENPSLWGAVVGGR